MNQIHFLSSVFCALAVASLSGNLLSASPNSHADHGTDPRGSHAAEMNGGADSPECCPPDAAHAHHLHRDDAPVSIMGTHVHPQGEWMLSYRFMRMKMDGMREGTDGVSSADVFAAGYTVTPESMTMNMHMLGIMYAPTDRLTLMAMANYIDTTMDHRIFSQMAANRINGGSRTFTTEADGFGDTPVSLLYDLHSGGSGQFIGGLGVSLPTGSIDETDTVPGMGGPSQQVLPAAMQPGSGTFDLLPSLVYVGERGSWSYGAKAGGVIRLEDENSQGYRRGHVFDLVGWTTYRLSAGFGISAGLNYRYTGELKGIQKNVGRMGPNGRSVTTAFNENYGGEEIEAILGAGWEISEGFFAGQRFAADLRLPLWQDLNGFQLETDWILTLGWQATW